MSRQCERLAGLLLAAAPVLLAGGGPALAQQAGDRAAQEMVDRARSSYGPMTPEQSRKACQAQSAQSKDSEIVVCAGGDDKEFRVQSSSQLDPNSRQATRTGVPRAPQLDRGSCKGKGQLGCFNLGGRAREIYMIDLKSIPETPEGSDAEKVAKGELADR